jgi:hypothetical protein
MIQREQIQNTKYKIPTTITIKSALSTGEEATRMEVPTAQLRLELAGRWSPVGDGGEVGTSILVASSPVDKADLMVMVVGILYLVFCICSRCIITQFTPIKHQVFIF